MILLAISLSFVAAPSAQPVTDGYLNVARSQAPGTLLSHPDDNDSAAIGRTTTLNYLNGWVIVGGERPGSASGSDLELRVYDIANPANPVRRTPDEFGKSYDSWHTGNTGYNAHGQAMVGNSLWPEGIYVNSWSGPVENTSDGNPRPWQDLLASGFNRSSLMSPWYASMTWYGSSTGDFVIRRKFRDEDGDVFTRDLASIDHQGQFGGGEWHPLFFGDLLIYARSQNTTGENGVVIYRLRYYDFDDPDNASVTPELVAASEEGLFGYWPNLYGYNRDALYLVGSQRNHIEVFDITAAVDPSVSGSSIVQVREDNDFPGWPNALSNASYPAYQDNHAFIHRYKMDMDRFIAGAPASEYRILELQENDEGVSASQMSLPLGNLWLTGGLGSISGDGRRQGMAVWVQDTAPDTRRPRVGYHIPQAGRVNYPRWAPISFFINETPRNGAPQVGDEFTVRKVNADGSLEPSIAGFTIRSFSSEITFTPEQPLEPDATYEVSWIADPSQQRGFRDAAGNYIEPYSFRFSTGALVLDPDPELQAPRLIAFESDRYRLAPGSTATLSVQAEGPSLEYRFRIGDSWSAWSSSPEFAATLPEIGRYNVALEVRNGNGTIAGALSLVAIEPATGPQPTRSTTLAVGDLSGEAVVWSLNPDNGSASVVTAADGEHVAEHYLCDHPRNIARDRNARFWVSCEGEDEIRVFTAEGQLLQRLSTGYGTAPHGLAASPDGSFVFVSLYSAGRLLRIAVDNYVVESIDTFATPRAIAVSGDGERVFVTRFISRQDYGEVAEFSASKSGLSAVRTFELAYADEVDGPQQASGVPNYVAGIAISPDGTRAVVTSKQDNTKRGLMYGRDPFTHDTLVRPIYSVLDLENHREITSARKDFDNKEGAYDVAFSPAGDLVLFTLQGSNSLVATDAIDLDRSAPHNVTLLLDQVTGLAPQGLLIDADRQRIFTQNFTGRSVTTYDAESLLATNTTSLGVLNEAASTAREQLTPQQLRGLQIFYNAADPRMSAESYISCATCHIDGGHDGRVWDLTERGEGLRRTIDLRGRSGMGHGNVHWSGNFDEIQDFEHDIRGAFGGEGLLNLTPNEFAAQHPDPGSSKTGLSSDLDALAAYVSSLDHRSVPRSPWRQSGGEMTPSAERGATIFANQGCNTCHAAPRYTNSVVGDITATSLVDPGTIASFSGDRLGSMPLAGVDAPTLLGLHANTRFLHHGQAETLRDALAFTGGRFVEGIGTLGYGTAAGGGGSARGMFNNDYVRVQGESEIWTAEIVGLGSAAARVGIRYASSQHLSANLIVDGIATPLSLAATQPGNNQGPARWRWHWLDVVLPGAEIRIEITGEIGGTLWIDGVLVPDPDAIADSDIHTRALALNEQSLTELEEFLLSLDGSDSQSAEDTVSASITIFDADSGADLGALTDEAQFPDSWADRPLTFQVIPSVAIGSVEIAIGQSTQTENNAPYFAFGDSGGEILGRGQIFAIGRHRLTATFYAERSLGGAVLGVTSVDFNIGGAASERPDTPQIMRTDVGDGEITLWLQATSAAGDGLQYRGACSDGIHEVVAASTSSRITIPGLVNGRSYRCHVTAVDRDGVSSAASARTSSLIPEEAPSGLPIWLLHQVHRASQNR